MYTYFVPKYLNCVLINAFRFNKVIDSGDKENANKEIFWPAGRIHIYIYIYMCIYVCLRKHKTEV